MIKPEQMGSLMGLPTFQRRLGLDSGWVATFHGPMGLVGLVGLMPMAPSGLDFWDFLEVNAALFALQVLFGGVAWSFLAQGMTGMTGMTLRESDCMP